MKNLIIGKSIGLVKKYNPDLSEDAIAEIQYGLLSLYLTVTKVVVILFISILLGIFKEVVLFLIFYNIIRKPSFGLHATKSWICLVSSTTIFLGVPYIATILKIPFMIKYVLGILFILLLFKNSPADTHKKPIINPTWRLAYKLITTIIASIYVIISLIVSHNFISNALLLALMTQSFITSPSIYRLFGLPYNNYKTYIPATNN